MSQITPAATDQVLVEALRAFVLAFVAPTLPVVRGMADAVSKPAGPQYVVITPLTTVRHATNLHDYDGEAEQQTITQRTTRRVQLDFYGSGADALAVTCSTLLRDAVAVSWFADYGVTPLHAEDATAMPEPDGRGRWTKRWTMDVLMQFDGTVTVPQPYFDSVNLTLHPQA